MPIRYSVDDEQSLVRLEVTDPLNIEEIAQTVKRLVSDSELRPGLNLLSDHSRLESTATTDLVKSIPVLLTHLGERLGTFRCAVIVPHDASFGMARMAEVFSQDGPSQVRACRSVAEAEDWLAGRPLDA